MKFSIITINYNNASGLEATLKSVACQAFKDFEHWVIDAASTDESVQVLQDWKQNYPQLLWLSEPDEGRYHAMNKGIERAQGDYLLFLNSGDTLVNAKVLEKVAGQNLGSGVAFGRIVIQHLGSEAMEVGFDEHSIDLAFLLKYSFPHQASFFHRSIFDRFGLYRLNYRIQSDHDYFIGLVQAGETPRSIPVTVARYDLNGISGDPLTLPLRNREKSLIFETRFGYPEVHFFTIVLDGIPFLRYHIEVFQQLKFAWHWHIVEGVAEHRHDTKWGLENGGSVPACYKDTGRSLDGTSEYVDELLILFPDRITVYRKPVGETWDGKLEMVQAPLKNIKQPCLLWQIDADELWTANQINGVRQLFQEFPDRTAAYFVCHFFVGPHLVTTSVGTYGNNLHNEWLRVWRFTPGDFWMAHEPPMLCQADAPHDDLAQVAPLLHFETAVRGLVFQHYAYALESQLAFKERYYGYLQATEGWSRLQKTQSFPVRLSSYFSWVDAATVVDTVASQGVEPLVQFMGDQIEFRIAPVIPAPSVSAVVSGLMALMRDTVLSQEKRQEKRQEKTLIDYLFPVGGRKRRALKFLARLSGYGWLYRRK